MIRKILRYLLTPLNDFLRFFVIYMPGATGRKLRYLYYRGKFKKCGDNVFIDEGVIIKNPEWVSVGDNVWIDKYSVLISGPLKLENCYKKKKENSSYRWSAGELIIGSEVHIGICNIIQSHIGVYIGDKVTTSAGVKIYSLSNYPLNENNPEMITYANCMVKESQISYILSPIVIEEGVWLGLNTIVLGGCIEKNSFITSNSIVIDDIPENSYASGNPAKQIKERFKN